MAYALQKPFQEELERLQKLNIIAPLGVNESAEWCNCIVLVPKANGMVRLGLDPAHLNPNKAHTKGAQPKQYPLQVSLSYRCELRIPQLEV